MPEQFQGLGLFNFNVDRLGAKILFLQRHWNMPETMGRMLMRAFHVFQMDTGIQGNIFTRKFVTGQVSNLADRSTWFYDLWRLCDHFNVDLVVNADDNIPRIREGDKALMECFIDLAVYTSKELAILGRCRKFFGAYWLSEVLRCDGCTLDPSVLEYRRYGGQRQLAYERPRRADLNPWKEAIQRVTLSSFCLCRPLGLFIATPLRWDGWRVSRCRELMYHDQEDGSHEVYK